MVVKSMVQQNLCQDCSQAHNCQEIYQKLTGFKGPSVVYKTSVAFLLPMLVFIASLAALERILAGMIDTKWLQPALSFLLALSVTFVCLLIIRTICHSCENRNPEK